MMRHPPTKVPRPMAVPQAATTQVGVWVVEEMVLLAIRASAMIPMVF